MFTPNTALFNKAGMSGSYIEVSYPANGFWLPACPAAKVFAPVANCDIMIK